MKNILKISLLVCLLFCMISCDNEDVRTPYAAIKIDKLQLTINESMKIDFEGVADQVVLYTGDKDHVFELREEGSTGFVVNKNLFTYAYSVPGVYKVVCVASTYGELGKELTRDTCSYTVTVIDDVTEIDRISCPQILYDEVFAERMANDEWLMKLPRRVKYSTTTAPISITQQRLKLYIPSDSTKVFINDVEYGNTTRYNLSAPLDISVRSNHGTVRPYTFHTLYYPEFETFKLLGATGTVTRTEFDYSAFEISVNLPIGTNVSNLIPEFTLYSSTDKVYVEGTEQTSGSSAVDFTNKVTYRIVSTIADKPEMKAESTVVVKVNYQ